MGPLAHLNFLIISSIILNFNEFGGVDGNKCDCRSSSSSSECPSDEESCSESRGCAETTEHSSPPTAATTVIPSDLICISTYDAILIVANINKLITDIQNSQKGIDESFNPMFDVVNVDGCFQLKLSEIYTSLFGSAVQEFLNNNVIGEINSLLQPPPNERAEKCPNESDAKMLIAIHLCAVGISFLDQLNKIPNIVNNILIKDAYQQLSSVNSQLSGQYYDTLYKQLVANGYEMQLKDAIILKKIASGSYTITLCKESGFIATTVASSETTATTSSFIEKTTTQRKPPQVRQPKPPQGSKPKKTDKNDATTAAPTTQAPSGTTTSSPISAELNSKNELTWSDYCVILGRSYTNLTTVMKRAQNFANSQKQIREHNNAFENGKATYKLQFTSRSDFSIDEVAKGIGKGLAPVSPPAETMGKREKRKRSPPPSAVDWRTFGAVTPVKDQGYYCGSCYAFCSVVVLEALKYFLQSAFILTSLSEQQIVDCTLGAPYYNWGCDYGWVENVFAYFTGTPKHGSMPDSLYAYTGTETPCKYNQSQTVLNITSWGYASCDRSGCPFKDEVSMKQYVASAPIVVYIYASCDKFLNYGNGVFNDPCCANKTSMDINHAMTAVGYGTDPVDGDYWILKNSWGTEWGENGYMRIKRGVNQCAVAVNAIYANL